MTICTASQAIAQARNWIGYIEKKSGSSLKDKTANAGYKNYTYFGKLMHKAYPQTMDYPAPWCDAFVDACIYLACDKVLADCSHVLCGVPDDYTCDSAKMYRDKNRWGVVPRIGAQIFFSSNGKIDGICHTGLVVSYDEFFVTTIEGNTSNAAGVVANGGCVAQKKYLRTNSRIAGYGYPQYKSNDEAAAAVSKYRQYEITASSLNVRDKRSTVHGKVCGSLPRGAKVYLTALKKNSAGNTWAKIAKGEYKGKFVAVIFHGNTYAKPL